MTDRWAEFVDAPKAPRALIITIFQDGKIRRVYTLEETDEIYSGVVRKFACAALSECMDLEIPRTWTVSITEKPKPIKEHLGTGPWLQPSERTS